MNLSKLSPTTVVTAVVALVAIVVAAVVARPSQAAIIIAFVAPTLGAFVVMFKQDANARDIETLREQTNGLLEERVREAASHAVIRDRLAAGADVHDAPPPTDVVEDALRELRAQRPRRKGHH